MNHQIKKQKGKNTIKQQVSKIYFIACVIHIAHLTPII